jgi:acetate---CoA ligase (ADP-forming)
MVAKVLLMMPDNPQIRPPAFSLDRLMRPDSVAIVGASAEPGAIGTAVLGNLERCGYRGAIHLVSRRAKEINGRPCVATIDDLPDGIDAAVLVVPQQGVVEAIAACGRRRIGGAVVFASGFAEVDEAGRAEQERLRQTACDGGVRVLGPNCIGFTNFSDGVALTFETIAPDPVAGRPAVAAVAQSGALAGALRLALVAKGLGVSYAISTGNEADLATEDFVAFLLDDPATRAIALFVEQFRRPQEFMSLADRARALGKAIVLLHPGKSRRAQDSASTHTGALAGDHAVMTAILRHKAVVLVDSIDDLIDTADVLTRVQPPVGGTGIITNSGAIKGFALDYAEQIGLDVPVLAPDTVAALRQALPPYASFENPVDVTAQVIKEIGIWTGAAAALLADPNIGSLAMLAAPGGPKQAMDKVHALLPAVLASGKPAVVAALGDNSPVPEEFFTSFRQQGVAVFRSPERAMRALALATAYGKALRALATETASSPEPVPPPPHTGTLPEYVGKEYLAKLGIRSPKRGFVTTLDDAKKCAHEIGYPVVLKAQAANLMHKTEAGGVIVGIEGDDALAAAWTRMQTRMADRDVNPDGFLIEAMAPRGIEMIVGARRDPDWGNVLMIGLGGIWTEALHDVRLMPADLSKDGIMAEVGRLKGAALLGGLRGAPPADLDALTDIAARVASVIRAHPEVHEIEINPLMLYADGALALDVLVVGNGGEG